MAHLSSLFFCLVPPRKTWEKRARHNLWSASPRRNEAHFSKESRRQFYLGINPTIKKRKIDDELASMNFIITYMSWSPPSCETARVKIMMDNLQCFLFFSKVGRKATPLFCGGFSPARSFLSGEIFNGFGKRAKLLHGENGILLI